MLLFCSNSCICLCYPLCLGAHHVVQGWVCHSHPPILPSTRRPTHCLMCQPSLWDCCPCLLLVAILTMISILTSAAYLMFVFLSVPCSRAARRVDDWVSGTTTPEVPSSHQPSYASSVPRLHLHGRSSGPLDHSPEESESQTGSTCQVHTCVGVQTPRGPAFGCHTFRCRISHRSTPLSAIDVELHFHNVLSVCA